MTMHKTTIYCVRGTAPATAEQVAFECEGIAMAHAKVSELRMAAYKDVVMSIRPEAAPVLAYQT
jgi:hypothetical protein